MTNCNLPASDSNLTRDLIASLPEGFPLDFTNFKIERIGDDWVASDGKISLIVPARGRVVHRRCYKPVTNERRSSLLAELNGVRLYVQWSNGGHAFVLTDEDLRV